MSQYNLLQMRELVDEYTDAIVKVVLHGTKEDLSKVSEQNVRQIFKEAKELVIAYDVQKESVARDREVNESISPISALEKYVGVLQLSSEEKAEVLRLGKEIMRDADTPG